MAKNIEPTVTQAENPLRYARQKAGVSVGDAAEALGLISTNLSAIESGRRSANPELLVKMSELYMLSCDQLLGRTPIHDF